LGKKSKQLTAVITLRGARVAELNTNLILKILDRIRSEYGTPKTRSNKTTVQNLRCPVCGDLTAWCYADNPWTIICNRKNECGSSSKVRDLFPDLFKSIEKQFPSIPEDPDRPARVYLESRGIRQAVIGLDFKYWQDVRGLKTGAVVFPVGKDKHGKTVFNGRLFDVPHGETKGHNRGSTSGLFWSHPGRKIDPEKPVYVTEGILDALSLIEGGLQAVAVLSSGQDPSKLKLDKFKIIITAFDNDNAGITASKKWRRLFKDKPDVSISSIFPDPGTDWNSLLQGLHGKNPREHFETMMPDFKFNADIALASSAQDYLDKFIEYKEYSPELFEHNGAFYFAKPAHKGTAYHAVQVSDFIIDVDYFQVDRTFPDRPLYQYGLSIKPKGRERRKVKALFEAVELSTAQNLAASMLKRARCAWTGDSTVTKAFYSMITRTKAREVRLFDSIGLDEETMGFMFPGFMIDKNGKYVLPDDKGLFSFPGNSVIRPFQYPKTIMPEPGISSKDLWALLVASWGDRAAVGIAYLVASWFVKDVRLKTGCFPFLSFYGDPQTGKSALVRALNRMQCINEEGLSMSKADTIKGITRKLSLKNSLFTGLSEVNKDDNNKMPIDSILTWYDGSALSVRAAFTAGKEIVEVPFLGSILFAQNDEPFVSPAQKSRVISLHFHKDQLSPDSMAAFLKLGAIPLGQMAHFFVQVMASRSVIEESWFSEYTRAKQELFKAVSAPSRIIENHSLMLGFHRLLCRVISIDYDLKPYIVDILKAKHESIQEREISDVDIFLTELAGWVRDCQNKRTRAYERCIDLDFQSMRLWVHVQEVINSIGGSRTVLMKLDLKKLYSELRSDPAFIKTSPHRFKYSTSDHSTPTEENKRGWCFDLSELDLDLDFTGYNACF
jgi:hypothetical protein